MLFSNEKIGWFHLEMSDLLNYSDDIFQVIYNNLFLYVTISICLDSYPFNFQFLL